MNTVSKILSNKHLIKYFFIGASASAIDLGVYLLLVNLFDWSPLAGHTVSVPLSAIYSFTLNAFLNFKTTDYLLARFFSFSVVVFLGYLVGAAVIWLIDDVLGLGANLGKVVSLPVVFVFQYLLNAKISFRSGQSKVSEITQ